MAVAITEEPASVATILQPLWHTKAPRKLVQHCGEDPIAGWVGWQKYLRKRHKPAAPPFLKRTEPAILWGCPHNSLCEAIEKALASPTMLAELAIGEDATSAPDLATSLQLVALAYALPCLAQELPAEKWWLIVERLHSTAAQARTEQVDWFADAEGVLRNQLLAGELPFALGYLFPEVRTLRELRSDARAALSEALVELTDGQGLLHARLLPVFGQLFACWTRCCWLGRAMSRGPWSRAAEQQFEWFVRHAIRLARADGTFMLSSNSADTTSSSDASASTWNKSLFQMALDLAGDSGDHAAAAAALPRGIAKAGKSKKRGKLPNPSLNSDWPSISVMSNGWNQSDIRIAVKYADAPPEIEINVAGAALLAGEWRSTTLADGQPLEFAGDWEQLCWQSDKQFDFLELGVDLTAGLIFERQILFGRQDKILYLADIIRSKDGVTRHLQHTIEMPLAPGAAWQPDAETRDGVITSGKARTAVLPLGLREWRADPRSGSLAETDGKLVLSQEVSGHALCCPLMIDLNTTRSSEQRTWRQLTIAEWMEVIPPDVAVGYRAQSGDDQWLIYRSLGQPGNRTLLGHNVAGEFCAGRFVDGKFKEWIEIEAV